MSKPGNSPANVTFGGNVVVGPTAGTVIELGLVQQCPNIPEPASLVLISLAVTIFSLTACVARSRSWIRTNSDLVALAVVSWAL